MSPPPCGLLESRPSQAIALIAVDHNHPCHKHCTPSWLMLFHAAVSEKLEFTDDGRKTDACAMTEALLTKLTSRAKN